MVKEVHARHVLRVHTRHTAQLCIPDQRRLAIGYTLRIDEIESAPLQA
jgi:hypothetical protein